MPTSALQLDKLDVHEIVLMSRMCGGTGKSNAALRNIGAGEMDHLL